MRFDFLIASNFMSSLSTSSSSFTLSGELKTQFMKEDDYYNSLFIKLLLVCYSKLITNTSKMPKQNRKATNFQSSMKFSIRALDAMLPKMHQ